MLAGSRASTAFSWGRSRQPGGGRRPVALLGRGGLLPARPADRGGDGSMASVDGSGGSSCRRGDRLARLPAAAEQARQEAGLGVDIPGSSAGAEEEDQEKEIFQQRRAATARR